MILSILEGYSLKVKENAPLRLDSEGILQEQLLRHLWRFEIEKDASNFDVFVELMKKFGLLFEKQKGSQPGNRIFMVPTRMQFNKEGLEAKEDEQQTVSIYVTPIDFLPDAVYNLLVVSFLDLMNDKGRSGDHVELFRNRSDFDLDDEHVVSLGAVKIKNRHALKIEISRMINVDEHGNEETLEPHPSVCMEVLSYLRQQLKTVYVTTEGVGYELRVLCNACEPTLRPLHKLEECLKKNSVPCGKRKSVSTTRIKRLFSTDFDDNSTQGTLNFLALQTLIVGRGTKELRRYFLDKTNLTKPEVKPFLTRERCALLKDVDFGDDSTTVFSSTSNIDAFHLEIMMKLIRYCCHNTNAEGFWENPPIDDSSELANLVRIYQYKKTVLDGSYSNSVAEEEFDNQWKELTVIFTGVGVPVEDIENYRDPWHYKDGAMEEIGFGHTVIEEFKNFQAVLSAVVVVGTATMANYILEVNKINKNDVGNYLMSEKRKGSFQNVWKNISKEQKSKMFTPSADIDTFDISIMYLIIRNCCVTIPASFWKNPYRLPNLVDIHDYRNKLAHSPDIRMSNKEFEIEWKKVRSMLHAAGASLTDIDKYKALRFIN
ncbi:uncharacterized protein LOC117113277 [Anneissia japonica]|uniref:uncharacterized protein LOC117113277 n=1 Tax=Anneissia japonica TaxID=1529436 RepID=UPI0014258B89|nr:uncharacterized protein LOC117113277 [Anneissia japonica]